jgi:hypothetical protein
VDQFQFDWSIDGGASVSAASYVSTSSSSVTSNSREDSQLFKTISGGLVDTQQSGAAYVYLRAVPSAADEVCGDGMDLFACVWREEVKYVASDKRAGLLFGFAVAINDTAGPL